MAKSPANNGKQWSKHDIQQLQNLANQNTSTRVIALKLERTANAVRSKASEENVSLNPTNQSPYNRQK
jgi:hypothetical protein